MNTPVFSFLFADYFLALSEFLKTIKTYKTRYNPETQEYTQEYPTVIYGQPSAAWRKIQADSQNVNYKPSLPVISFVALSFTRVKGRQNPYVRYSTPWIKSETLPEDKYASESKAPQVYRIQYNVSVWTNNNKSRDDLISRIVREFNPTLTLRHYSDPTNNPHLFLYMPFEIEDEITDSSEFETLEEKDTRDVIRTDFMLTSESVLPMETKFYRQIKSVGVNIFQDKIAAAHPEGQYRLDFLSEEDGEPFFVINKEEKLQ